VDGPLSRPYRFTTNAPAADWTSAGSDDSSWHTGLAPFGNALPGIRTPWKNNEIWLRQKFEAADANIRAAAIVVFYDEDTEVYLNGQQIWKRSGFATRYEIFSITDAVQKALKKGANTLAVHTRQSGGGQFIDLALLCDYGDARTVKR
jgi:hypothetical protein